LPEICRTGVDLPWSSNATPDHAERAAAFAAVKHIPSIQKKAQFCSVGSTPFAYVYFLRSTGLLNGLAAASNWVFRDESMHINFAFEVINRMRSEMPALFNAEFANDIT